MSSTSDNVLRSLFLRETRENLQLLTQMIGQMEAGLPDAKTFADASRAAHSLKGGAALLKFETFRQLAAGLETCLSLLSEAELPDYEVSLPLFQRAAALLITATDRIEAGVEEQAVVPEEGNPLIEQLQVLQEMLQAAVQVPPDQSAVTSTLEDLLTQDFETVLLPPTPDLEQTLDQLLGDLEETPSPIAGQGSDGDRPALEDLNFDLEDWIEASEEESETVEIDIVAQVKALEAAIADLTQHPHEQPLSLGIKDDILSAVIQAAPRLPVALTLEPVAKARTQDNGKTPVVFEQTLRVPVRQLDNLSNLVGEIVVSRNTLESDQSHLRETLENLMLQVHQLGDLGERMRELYERSLLETALAARRQLVGSSTAAGSAGASTFPTEQFDDLELDRFSGFHSISQEMMELLVRLREAASDIDFMVNEPFDQLTRNFQQITLQLQSELNQTRMVPFSDLTDQLPRAVREISRRCGKGARLEIEGKDILIDKMILQKLQAPMTHLINNALSHGIETAEIRQYRNKSAEGTLVVRASLQGNRTLITVTDDGAGIDAEQVKLKALARGLITPEEAAGMRVREIYELLFRPGFSTRDQADELAGRGVGLDVVRRALHEIQGEIVVDSELGKGTTFTFRLPLTLSITKALTCLHERARLAFPMDSVEEMLDIPQQRLAMDPQGQLRLDWHNLSLPVFPLSSLLDFHLPFGRSRYYNSLGDDGVVSIVVLRNDNEYLAVQTDQIEGEREIVIKQIEGPIAKPLGILGITVRSDGQVMPIVDVLELFDIAYGRVRQRQVAPVAPSAGETRTNTEPMVLIVDDSITVRELLSMTFKKAGYVVEQARNGQEALEKLYSGLPCDLVFCDIEMPKMNGLELLERLQADPKLRSLPVAMLTSRGADRHRQIAAHLGARAYFTKPYLEEQLLEASARLRNGERLI
ncbi:hybrid sensor histidine kinase/response regulator [Synechococcus elongatus]|uniref:histidine kinase n=1 Tax=Synechococcus elongatus (strain ATCC 33912 / PCC 7942 / FACHB-805) TaxID=1140 RepID=Q31PH5_SYNE7|nr:hybrid sensor histidine kinase/response regulator [Synechococcus elongatus]ABB57044.1 CheA signal transduction histidine kinase [Synechococcus elongatus PCC 7942 = FACHB-805]AJD58436.1 chemotaxis protein CheY [Synechococcus elongatus UTEX 2973]MBD2587446.1 hybrid sensor histidine kinase/response regulator [Synechococcus elongatus FACHB-242]MBD2688775.1 hybrid sensor histidine kinase/response regulator [Synechococcus elongatus FACHB-1061]MBD2707846.1 hybrid sensor histidine kinase/response r